MIKICIEDLSACEALDREGMGRVRGGHSFCGPPRNLRPRLQMCWPSSCKHFPKPP